MIAVFCVFFRLTQFHSADRLTDTFVCALNVTATHLIIADIMWSAANQTVNSSRACGFGKTLWHTTFTKSSLIPGPAVEILYALLTRTVRRGSKDDTAYLHRSLRVWSQMGEIMTRLAVPFCVSVIFPSCVTLCEHVIKGQSGTARLAHILPFVTLCSLTHTCPYFCQTSLRRFSLENISHC